MTGPCLVFVPPLSPHGFSFSSDVDGRVITLVAQQLHARLAAVPELRPAFDAAACRLLAPGSAQATQLDTVLAAVVNEFQGHAPWRSSAIDAALTLALLVVGRTLAPASRPEEGAVSSRGRRHVQRFLADVELGFRELRTIESYAAPLGITATQLNRLCRQLLGRSALQTVHARARLEAERDLAYTSLSIKEIALGLGFTDAAYFTRFFMRERGTSPSDYRKAVRRRWEGLERELARRKSSAARLLRDPAGSASGPAEPAAVGVA